MKKKSLLLFLLSLSLVYFACSQGPAEAGDSAMADGNYGEALKNYLEALKAQPENSALREKIATAYFKQGEAVYQRGHVIRAFEDRVQRGKSYLPENPSPEMQKTLSEVNLQMALAYQKARPENPYQKKNYFDRTLFYLEQAMAYDSTNQEIAALLVTFKNEHFQEMLDKGIADYKKGSTDPLFYLSAEYYLNNALNFRPDNSEAARYLKLTRRKALNLLDPGQDTPLAVTDRMENEEYLAFLVVLHNQTEQKIPVNPGSFYLVAKDNKSLRGKSSEMFSGSLKAVTLENGEETSGVVAFPRQKQQWVRLEFRYNNQVLGYKNLP